MKKNCAVPDIPVVATAHLKTCQAPGEWKPLPEPDKAQKMLSN